MARRDHELRARFEHLRALNSSWAVLETFDLPSGAQHIVETGRAVSQELEQLAEQSFDTRDRTGLPKLDKLLDAIESDMRALAFEVPVAELRTNLPTRLSSERRGVLDLLDLMLLAELEGHAGSAGRINAIDYLITLLCTGGADGDGTVLHDPVGLTPRLHALCERTGGDEDPRQAEAATAFYLAADGTEEDARHDVQLRALGRRKREIGARFFEPGVLRAVVTYNATMSRCIKPGTWDARDWGSLADGSEPSGADTSVFESDALPRLAEALRRRATGGSPNPSAIDRVAWCLDLTSLDETERAALFAPTVGLPGDLAGTHILVGLLSRSAVLLEAEFPAIGISAELVSAKWPRELEDGLKREADARAVAEAKQEARVLYEMRTSSLHSSTSDAHRKQRRALRPAEPVKFASVEQEAMLLANEASDQEITEAALAARTKLRNWRSWPWAQIATLAGGAGLAGLLAVTLANVFLAGDLEGLSGSELDRLSPYLERGGRTGEGLGPAFVGTIDDDWTKLPADAQLQTATEMVTGLRAQGVREIMVYDDESRLRIQALGEQSVSVLPTPNP